MRIRHIGAFRVLACLLTTMICASAAAQSASVDIDIKRQPMSAALRDLANQTGLQILFRAEDVSAHGKDAPAVAGRLSAKEALERLLAKSGLKYEFINDHTVRVLSDPKAPPQTNVVAEPPTSRFTAPLAKSLNPPVLAEVTVTAMRREESISKVPISLSAYTQESMDRKGVRDFTDIARYTPGVQIDSGQTNAISIRGISSSAGAGTTGIYIDDTPIQMRAMGANPDDTLPKTFDLERVEVLRGPQGTLFGAGSEGGTVRYIMAQPSLSQTTGYARAESSYTQGGSPSYETGAAFGAPLIDGMLGFRVSAWCRHDGGWIDRIDPTTLATVDSNVNHDDTIVLRAAALWAPSDSVRLSPSILWQDRKRHDFFYYWPLYSGPDGNRFVSADPTGRPEPDQYLLPALKITADIGAAQLISNTSYYRRRDISGYEGTLYNLSYFQTLGWASGAQGGAGTLPGVGSFPYAGTSPCAPQGFSCYPLLDGSGVHLPAALANYRSPASVNNDQDNITQEIRLQSSDPTSRIAWTAGAFYSLGRSYSFEQIHDPMNDAFFNYVYGTTLAGINGTARNPDGSTYLPMGDSYLNQLTGYDRQLAGFGEGVWSLTPRLKLTTGVRYSKTDFTFNAYEDGPENGGSTHSQGQQHERPLTERAGLAYQVDNSNLVYATFSTGFRIGGVNAAVPYHLCSVDLNNFGLSQVPSAYKSDRVRSYEIGAKNNIEQRIRLASSIYYIRWTAIQQTVVLSTCDLLYTANLGTAESEGFDLQAQFAVTDALSVELAVGYDDAHYISNSFPSASSKRPVTATGDAIVGQSGTPGAPWTVTLGAEYRFNLFDRDSYIRMDSELQTRNTRKTAAEDPFTAQFAECSTARGVVQPCNVTPTATTFVSLRAGQELKGWNVSGFIDNLLNTHAVTNRNYQGVDGFGPQLPTPYTNTLGVSAPVATPLYRALTFRPRTFGVTATFRY